MPLGRAFELRHYRAARPLLSWNEARGDHRISSLVPARFPRVIWEQVKRVTDTKDQVQVGVAVGFAVFAKWRNMQISESASSVNVPWGHTVIFVTPSLGAQ